MPATALLGIQWGDEGKGKVIDHLTANADVVVRFQGGGNAGHTVVVGEKQYILHHLPSGILHEGKTCIIGPGLVVDPVTLTGELEMVMKEGIDLEGRVLLDYRAHLVLPHHRFQDGAAERRRGKSKIGTTGRGIGPTYGDKMARIGIRAGDLLEPDLLEEKIALFADEKKRLFGAEWTEEYGVAALGSFLKEQAARLSPLVCDGVLEVRSALEGGRSVLFEGAQGTLLDIDLGTYPYVTSSNTTVGAIFHGGGVAPREIKSVVGVTKAYMTRVGAGAFPTELPLDEAASLREKGAEFGATTGRPRRCGWLDGVAGRYAVQLNGVDTLAVTKLDVLSGLDRVAICTEYDVDGERATHFDPRAKVLAKVKPVYEFHDGWKEEIVDARGLDDLPATCRKYLDRVEEVLGSRIGYVSVGPERSQIIEV
ncbi:MAG: adenylosuccinate synthase [Planctomycetota bacterium]